MNDFQTRNKKKNNTHWVVFIATSRRLFGNHDASGMAVAATAIGEVIETDLAFGTIAIPVITQAGTLAVCAATRQSERPTSIAIAC